MPADFFSDCFRRACLQAMFSAGPRSLIDCKQLPNLPTTPKRRKASKHRTLLRVKRFPLTWFRPVALPGPLARSGSPAFVDFSAAGDILRSTVLPERDENSGDVVFHVHRSRNYRARASIRFLSTGR